MPNLAEFLVETAGRHPERAALRLGATVISYSELDERSARAAALLQAEGLRPGDRVALMLPNVPEFVVLYYGILRAGGIVVPMKPAAQGPRDRLSPGGLRRGAALRMARGTW
jgi:long-chain acyl-CoA synthetase